MLYLLGGFAVLSGFLLLVYLFVNADPARLARGLKVTGKRNFKVRALVTSSRTGRTRAFDMTPNEARTAWDGEVTLFAGEPDVKQPIAFAMDDRGRLWVAEAYTYPIRAAEGQGRDRILVFEDMDGDEAAQRS